MPKLRWTLDDHASSTPGGCGGSCYARATVCALLPFRAVIVSDNQPAGTACCGSHQQRSDCAALQSQCQKQRHSRQDAPRRNFAFAAVSLRLNLHLQLHVCALDGVYVEQGDDAPRFMSAADLDSAQLCKLAEKVSLPITKYLRKHDYIKDDDEHSSNERMRLASCPSPKRLRKLPRSEE